MARLRRILALWLVTTGLSAVLCGVIYLVALQVLRHLANDPQIQLARDAAVSLEHGKAPADVVPPTGIDFSRSLAPFVMVLDDAGNVLATSGTLAGSPRSVPAGALDSARTNGENDLTWQPERGVRLATAIVPYRGSPSGFVVAGRSLSQTEERVGQLQRLIALAWVLIAGGLGVLVAIADMLTGTR